MDDEAELMTLDLDATRAFAAGHDDLLGQFVSYRGETWIVQGSTVRSRSDRPTTVMLTLLRSRLPVGTQIAATLD